MSKFHKTDPLQIPELLEKWFRSEKAIPYAKEKYRGYEYYLAEGGPFFDAKDHKTDKDPLNDDPDFYKNGYYVAAFCYMCINHMYNINTPFGLAMHFPINHDLEDTQEGRRKRRIGSIRKECKLYMDYMLDDPGNHLLEKREAVWTPPKEPTIWTPGHA